MNIYGAILITGFLLLSLAFLGGIVVRPLFQYWKCGRANGFDLWIACFVILLISLLTTIGLGSYTITDGNLLSLIGTVVSGTILYRAINLSYSDATSVDFEREKLMKAIDEYNDILIESIRVDTAMMKDLEKSLHKNANLN